MLSPDLKRTLCAQASTAATPQARGQLVREWTETLGISRSTILRTIAASGVKPTRVSAGGIKAKYDHTDEQFELIVGHIYRTIRQNGKKITGVAEAVRMAELHRQIPDGEFTVSEVRRWMAAHDLLVRDIQSPVPTGQLYSKYPNQVQLFDASVCLQWEFPSPKEQMKFWNWKLDLGRNKIVEEVTRRIGQKRSIIWRIAITDHFSHLIYVRYYQLSGESAVATARFLQDAWFPKSNPSIMFQGVPEILIADRGPGNKSQIVENLCRNYGVELRLHETGHAWAKGSVEVSHNIIETHFECFLSGNPPCSIEELNTRAEDWQARYNANQILRRNGYKVDTRNNLWSQNVEGHLRVPDSIPAFQMAASRSVEEITVNVQGYVRVKIAGADQPKMFRVPDQFSRVFGRGKLKIIVNPFLYRDEQSVYVGIDLDNMMAAKEVELRAGGFLKSARPIHHPTVSPTNLQEEFRRRTDALQLPPAAIDVMSDAERHRIAAQSGRIDFQSVTAKTAATFTVRFTLMEALNQIWTQLPWVSKFDRAEVYRELSVSTADSPQSAGTFTDADIDALIIKYRDRFARRATSAAG